MKSLAGFIRTSCIKAEDFSVEKKFLSSLWQLDSQSPQFVDGLLKMRRLARRKLSPKAFYSKLCAIKEKDSLLIYAEKEYLFSLKFARLGEFCIADSFDENAKPIAFSLVTLGFPATQVGDVLYKNNEFLDYFLWHGYCGALTEAFADYAQAKLLCVSPKKRRFSFGYPSCGELAQQNKIIDYFNTIKTGIESNESGQLEPLFTTCAVVIL